jgi:hypothetical protein
MDLGQRLCVPPFQTVCHFQDFFSFLLSLLNACIIKKAGAKISCDISATRLSL